MTTQTLTRPSTNTLHPVAEALMNIKAELSLFFKERDSVLEAAILALGAAQHLCIVGPPGTGKSLLIRTLFGRFTDAPYFEAALSKGLPGEAVLGPWSIPKLRDEGTMERNYDGYLPTAKLGLLDEAGKASPTFFHALLAVVNERVLHQVGPNGRSTIDLPLSTLATGTNELLTAEGGDSAAMWDRLPVRVQIDYIQEIANWIEMIDGPSKPLPGTTIAWPDMQDVIDNVIPAVTIPFDVKGVLATLFGNLRAAGIIISDRRWKQAMGLLRTSAFLDGRTEVTTDDIQVLRFTLWDTPMQISQVERLTLSVSNPLAEKALDMLGRAEEIAGLVRDSKAESDTGKRSDTGVELGGRLRSVIEDLGRLRGEAEKAGASTTRIDEAAAFANRVNQSILQDLMGFDLATLLK